MEQSDMAWRFEAAESPIYLGNHGHQDCKPDRWFKAKKYG